jgi:ATP-dependent protease ClpP protease subunit
LREKLDEAKKNANETQFKQKTIYLYINSGGGCAYAGISGLNMIKSFPCKIITIADGFVASAATLLYLAGTKRYISRFSQVLIHQVSTAFYGKYTELKDEVKNSTDLMESFKKFYKKTTNLTPELIDEYLSKELCFTSTECKKYGLAHKIK